MMKFGERMQLIKAGYTKKEIAEMEKESAGANNHAGTDDRLDLIAQAVAKLTDDFHEMNIRNDAAGGKGSGDEPDIWEKLRASLAGEDPNNNDEGGTK